MPVAPEGDAGEEKPVDRAAGSRKSLKRDSSFRKADKYAGVGFQVAMAMVFYVLVGNWLDKKLGSEPWLTLIGAVLGFGSMMYILVRFAADNTKPPRDDDTPG